jgi:hypothetical protein
MEINFLFKLSALFYYRVRCVVLNKQTLSLLFLINMPDEQNNVEYEIIHGGQWCYIEYPTFFTQTKIAICHFVRLRIALFGFLILDEYNMVCYHSRVLAAFSKLNDIIYHPGTPAGLYCVVYYQWI